MSSFLRFIFNRWPMLTFPWELHWWSSDPACLLLCTLKSMVLTVNIASKLSNVWSPAQDASGSVSAAKTVEIRHSALITSMAFFLLFDTSGKPGQRPERHSCCLPVPQEKKLYKYFGIMHIFHQIAEISSNWGKTMNSVITAVTEVQSILFA